MIIVCYFLPATQMFTTLFELGAATTTCGILLWMAKADIRINGAYAIHSMS